MIQKPPAPSSGDAIDLKPLLGKTIAVKVWNRRTVETKFGERPLVNARIMVLGNNEPLEGVMFQSYFAKTLKEGEWYCGIVSRNESGGMTQWFLKDAPAKSVAALEKQISAITDDDVPF